MALNPQVFCQQIAKRKHPMVKWTAKYVLFFIVAAIKKAVLVSLSTTPVS